MSTEKEISKLSFLNNLQTDSDLRDEYAAYLSAVIEGLEYALYVYGEDEEAEEKLDKAINDLENL